MAQEKVPCPKCGKLYTVKGLPRHEKSCKGPTGSGKSSGKSSKKTSGSTSGGSSSLDTISTKINEIITYIHAQDERIRLLENKVTVLEKNKKFDEGISPKAQAIGDLDFLTEIKTAFSSMEKKIANKVPIPEIVQVLTRKLKLSEDEIYTRILSLFYNGLIELQQGKPLDRFRDPNPNWKFYWLGIKK